MYIYKYIALNGQKELLGKTKLVWRVAKLHDALLKMTTNIKTVTSQFAQKSLRIVCVCVCACVCV
jgi:hypothetical protein